MSVRFGKKQFAVVWSAHACDRIVQRCKTCEDVGKLLMQSLNYAEQYVSDELENISGEFTLYDKTNDIFAGLYVNRKSNNIFVTSYGPASEFYPRNGCLTLQINKQGSVRIIHWKVEDSAAIDMGRTCHFGGKDLNLRWSKWSANMMKDDFCLEAIGKRRVKEIMEIIESTYDSLPSNTLINIWNWLTGVFISIVISYENSTCDVVLYKTTHFCAERDMTHIDITENGCHMVLAGSS